MTRHARHDLAVALILAEAILQPGAAPRSSRQVVDLVRGAVGDDGRQDHEPELKVAALGEERSRQEHGLPLDRDSEEEDEVAVLEKQTLHTHRSDTLWPAYQGTLPQVSRQPAQPAQPGCIRR